MNSTEQDRVRALAGALFDEVVAPLAEARKAAGRLEYFPLTKDAGAESYFQQPILRGMGPADFEFPGGGAVVGLLNALAAHWTAAGETELAALVPRLQELAAELRKEVGQGDGNVSILCYTMF